jgi:uncharacterized protein YbbK (DUF523 family)
LSMLEGKGRVCVSACLAGLNCSYKGKSRPNEVVLELVRQGRAVMVCPEQLGGLSTPRPPAEKVGEKVLTNDGKDVTAECEEGAERALQIALREGCESAILYARSPSCGSGEIFDGSFTGKTTKGNGVFAEKLKKAGIRVFTNEEV